MDGRRWKTLGPRTRAHHVAPDAPRRTLHVSPRHPRLPPTVHCRYHENVPRLPLVAIVGRPNVGKSTLFNRLTHSRRSLVGDEPGITRDRIYGTATWEGRPYEVVDTGGMLPGDAELIPEAIFRQAQTAIRAADAILFVVDGRSAITATDRQLAQLLHRTGKPVLLVVNKVDSDRQERLTDEFHEMGLREIYGVSSEHGLGFQELLEALATHFPPEEAVPEAEEASVEGGEVAASAPLEIPEVRIAIVGRPNVGKSTLLNKLTGEERSIVSEVAGTTRDAVDALVVRDGRRYRFVDTAGIRRKGKTHLMAEKLSVVMARKHLEEADVALVMIDAGEGVVSSDATIAGYASESGKSVILVVNKWDLARARGVKRQDFDQAVRDKFKFLAYAPIVFLTARDGQGVGSLYQEITRVAAERRKRISTAQINRFLATVDFKRAGVPRNQQVKIYYLSQVGIAPPCFVLFVDKARELHFSYQRFLENQLRAAFSFRGTPIVLKLRVSGGKKKR